MLESILSITSIIIALLALGLSVFSYRQSHISNVKEFFMHGDSQEMKLHRKVIYDIYNQYSEKEEILEEMKKKSDEISYVISFYDFWSLMVKKGYLPKWTFQDSSKHTTINIYQKVKDYIDFRRIEQPKYASHFEWLIHKI